MTIDVRTLLVLLLIASVLMAMILSVGAGTRGRGLGRWNFGLGMISVGWALLLLRGEAPELVTKPLANTIFLTGLLLQADAIREFGGSRPGRWHLVAGGVATFLLLWAVMDDYLQLTLATSTIFSALLFSIAVLAARLAPESGHGKWILTGMNLLAAMALAGRVAGVASAPERYPNLMAPELPQIIAFVVLFCAIIGSTFAFLLMHRDRAEDVIRRLAMVDALTGLLNRRALLEQAERELARARRAAVPFTVLMIDLDHFKRVNDVHGHQTGDRVLADFAGRLRDCVRAGDLVGRYGGEEFCAVLPGASMERALAVGERIRAATEAHPLGGLPSAVTVSVGAAILESNLGGTTVDAALAAADSALYAAKKAGRNRVVASAAHDPLAPLDALTGRLGLVA